MSKLPKFADEKLLVGTETSDDAAVYQISDELAMIQTVDFFTPIVDDPYTFGQIAAANSLSDIYAMGGEPKLALNIAAFPSCLDVEILGEILRGGADKVMEAGAVLAGGHTITDDEPKYGLCVTGFADPKRLWKNYGAKTGDVLILTKPLGSGILNTAIKAQLASQEERTGAIAVMQTLNKYAADICRDYEIHCCTDVTGFGFGGHALEMAKGSRKTLVIDTKKLPLLAGAKEYAQMGLIPAGAYRNREFCREDVRTETDQTWLEDVVYDPQTSGGLLLAAPRSQAQALLQALSALDFPGALVGVVTEAEEKALILK